MIRSWRLRKITRFRSCDCFLNQTSFTFSTAENEFKKLIYYWDEMLESSSWFRHGIFIFSCVTLESKVGRWNWKGQTRQRMVLRCIAKPLAAFSALKSIFNRSWNRWLKKCWDLPSLDTYKSSYPQMRFWGVQDKKTECFSTFTFNIGFCIEKYLIKTANVIVPFWNRAPVWSHFPLGVRKLCRAQIDF